VRIAGGMKGLADFNPWLQIQMFLKQEEHRIALGIVIKQCRADGYLMHVVCG
jgi:hypothetical protein